MYATGWKTSLENEKYLWKCDFSIFELGELAAELRYEIITDSKFLVNLKKKKHSPLITVKPEMFVGH